VVNTTPAAGHPHRALTHDPDARRYALHLDGELAASVDYDESASSISFTHTVTTPAFRGQGLAGEIVTFAVDDVEKSGGKRIIPACSYVATWFEKHPERSPLLSR
jgi:predicted GNAT family acetyltransferase